ncbi:MAG: alpha-1,2-fucosyltransferase [Patescibacteria group bacterium]|nr:alpha-1,2-fucosyltransferase [Patescibacteria group bacterium]
MIIINLKGGLGNQLFQYAAGRALSLRQENKTGIKVPIKLDITGYGKDNGIDTVRRYSLEPFNTRASIANRDEIRRLKYPFGVVSKGWRFFKAKILRQFNTGFVPRIFNTKGPIYLDGFFQTEKYFLDTEKEIRSDLTLKNPFSVKAQGISAQIEKTVNSVSIHVRRGDYVTDAKTNQHHGTCGHEYYSKALEYIASKIGTDFTVFVFSDDIEWVNKNLPLPYPAVYVSSPDIPDYEELILMSQCHNHIIANSSFSWWGAWLNPHADKIVVAPKQWVRTGKDAMKDIVPNSWIRL